MEDIPLQTLTKELIDYLIEEAVNGYPYEIGGLLIEYSDKRIQLLPCRNAIEDHNEGALDYFMLDSLALARAEQEGTILAIYHSHPMTPPNPSAADLKACIHSNYPMIIVNPLTRVISYTTPEQAEAYQQVDVNTHQILGRNFVWGVYDCYGLVRDVYKEYLNITLPDFDRGMLFEWDYKEDWDKFTDNFKDAGFILYPVPRNSLGLLQEYDVPLMNVAGKFTNPNHCGVLVKNQDFNKLELWHHLYAKEAAKSVYGGYWVNCTTSILRHKSLI